MPFLERLQSAMILKTPMHQHYESHIVEHLHAPFYEAIRNSDHKTIATMIEEGFDIDFHQAAHIPPLIYAIIHKQASVTRYLLKHGANVNILSPQGENALHVSIQLCEYDTISLLLNFGALLPNRDTISDPIVLTLLDNISPMQQDEVSCFNSAKKGDLVSLSLTCNANVKLFSSTQHGYNLLHLATYSANKDLIVYLLNKGLDIDGVDNNGNTALNIAVKFEDYEDIISLLIQRHASLDHQNEKGQTPLTSALRSGFSTISKLLIDNGANIHVVDNLHTPLTLIHNSILRYPNHADDFRSLESELLIRGAHVNIPANALGWTPLYLSISKMQTHVLKLHLELLIQLGADINYLDSNKRPALMIASSLGRYEAVEILLNNYAKIDLLDNFGWSALMLGVYYNHYKIVKLLLHVGADANLTSPQQFSALKIAKQHKRDNIVSLLLDYGATEEENTE
ncbi:MAG: ankyrin repeat domain-containing protein [Campylobacterota bacterium]|nr:ankyrin repeat domain-containing protein [Campylobacterota bacterium]